MYKILSLLIALLFLNVGNAQDISFYAEIEFHADHIPTLVENGVGIDHIHRHKDGNVETVLSNLEIDLLEALNIPYTVNIADMKKHYKEILKADPPNQKMACGLSNYNGGAGSMGGYNSYSDMQTHINNMKTFYPDLVSITDIGQTHEGRSIFAVKISDNVEMDESNEEGVSYFEALTHAREPMGLETTLFYMWWLLENYLVNSEATYLVNNREIYFVPVVNPDGYVYNETTDPNGGGFWRKNRRDDGINCKGVDLNRNYSYDWGNLAGSSDSPCSDLYHGPEAFSEPETQAIRDFVLEIKPATAFSTHTYSDVMIYPNNITTDSDFAIYTDFASEFLPESYYGYGNTPDMIGYVVSGTTSEYLHEQGTKTYTPEIGHQFWEAPSEICQFVLEAWPTLKFLTWASGDFTSFHDFQIVGDENFVDGENIDFTIRLKNRGLTQEANNVTVNVSSDHPSLVGENTTVSYGNILPLAFQSNASNPFQFSIQGAVALGEEIAINVEVLQDGEVSYTDVIYLYGGNKNIVFYEDFENGMGQWQAVGNSNWNTTTVDAWGGSYSLQDSPTSGSSLSTYSVVHTIVPIDLSNAVMPFLEYNLKWSFDGMQDEGRIDVSGDGGTTWTPVEGKYTTNYSYRYTKHWVQERVNLSAFNGQEDVRVRFSIGTDYGRSCDGFTIDDVRVVDYTNLVNNENVFTKNMEIFPNPTSDILVLKNLSSTGQRLEVKLLNSLGQLVKKEQLNFLNGNQQEELDVSNVQPGIYYLLIGDGVQFDLEKVVVF